MFYRIRNIKTRLLWSNEYGWGGEGYTLFTQAERDTLSLPLDGFWEQDAELTIIDYFIFETMEIFK
jgi:hypothetical protein